MLLFLVRCDVRNFVVTFALVVAVASCSFADVMTIDLIWDGGTANTSIFHAMPNSNTGGEGADKVVADVGEDLSSALYYFDMTPLMGMTINSATLTVSDNWWGGAIPDVEVHRIDTPIMWQPGDGLWSNKWGNDSGAGKLSVDWDAGSSSGHDWAGNALTWWDPAATQFTSALADIIDIGTLNTGGSTDYDILSLVQNWSDGTWENKGMALYAGNVSAGGVVNLNSASVTVNYTPEPASLLFISAGALGLIRRRRMR